MKLVSGGTGLLGSHLLYELSQGSDHIRAIYRRKSGIEKTRQIFSYYGNGHGELFNKIEWVRADVLDICKLEEVCRGVKEVYHCAAVVSFDRKKHDVMYKTNVEGTANMLNAAIHSGVEKFCHVSSIASFGRPEDSENTINEKVQREENSRSSVYSISKYQAELEVWRAVEEGLNAVIINPSTIIGSGNWDSGSSALFTKVAKGLSYYTEGVNGFVDVRDVVGIMKALMEKNIFREQFILVSENLSFRDLISYMADGLGLSEPRIRASKVLSALAWRLDVMKSSLLGTDPVITKESARIALDRQFYSSEKVKERLQMEFIPIRQSILEASRNFNLA